MFKKCLSFIDVAKEFLIKYLQSDILKLINLDTLKFYKSNDELLEIIYFAQLKNNSSNSIYLLIQYLPQLNFYSPMMTYLSVERIMVEHMLHDKYTNSPKICVLGFYNGDEKDPGRKYCIDVQENSINNPDFAREILFGTHLVN